MRRRRAKATLDFATGEVHDRAVDAAGNPRAIEQVQGTADADMAPGSLSPEELSNEDRALLGIDADNRRARARRSTDRSRRWVKPRKIP
jgi:hypothetical protein